MDKSNLKMISKLMLRLLPVQVLLAGVGAVNGLVSSFFASNYIGINAMSAVGLYTPIIMLLNAISMMLAGGCSIVCGKYLGRNEYDKIQGVMSMDLVVSSLVAAVIISVFVVIGTFGLTGIFTKDAALQPVFGRYLMWQSLGVFPFLIGNQLAPFLAMENRSSRTLTASLAYIAANLLFDFLFIKVLRLEEMGLALASALGMWIFMFIQAGYFASKKSTLKIKIKASPWKEFLPIIVIGFPGAASFMYQTLRGFIVNGLLETYTGSMGLSAFAAAGNFMNIFWAVPNGMLAVSRLVMSVSIGEEDRQTLVDVMRVMMRRYLPIICAVMAFIMLGAAPFSGFFFKDHAVPAYGMMVSGLRILPLSMPFALLYLHMSCYGQASGKQLFVNIFAFIDGVLCVALFSFLFIKDMGINAVYIANVLNGVVTTIIIYVYAWAKHKSFPKNMEQLMVIPEGFGVPEDDRIDISIRTKEEVVSLSDRVRGFCLSKGIDSKRSYYAALALEEMAGNIVEHGFEKDKKSHSVDVRVVYKDENVILRIKDDCVAFDPKNRAAAPADGDITKNMGIRMIYSILKDIDYQNMLGLNVLTIKI